MLHYFVHVYVCQHLYFVDAYIFVVAYILVGTYIMSAPIFWGRLGFVNAYILSMSIFFRHLYLTLSLAARAGKKLPLHKESLQSGS